MNPIVNENENVNVKYGYFQAETPSGMGYICVALTRPAKGMFGDCSAGFSFYSPKENVSFSKELARKVAVGRLNTLGREKSRSISFEPTNTCQLMNLFVRALEEGIFNNLVPSWVLRAARNNKLFLGLGGKIPVSCSSSKSRGTHTLLLPERQ
jgi:hypothetical protein